MMRCVFVFVITTILCLGSSASASEKMFGKEMTPEEPTSISTIGKPVEFAAEASPAAEATPKAEVIPETEPKTEASPESETQSK
jgi:hypothetical protein